MGAKTESVPMSLTSSAFAAETERRMLEMATAIGSDVHMTSSRKERLK
jgi:hypothetical protein